MLCSQNSGKYLSGTWHENVRLAVEDTDNFTSSELSFLEMDGVLYGPVGKLKRLRSSLRLKTQPVDPQNRHQEDYIWNEQNPAVGDQPGDLD